MTRSLSLRLNHLLFVMSTLYRLFPITCTGHRPCPSVFHAPVVSRDTRSEEHTSELQSLMRISYAVFCLKKKNRKNHNIQTNNTTKKTKLGKIHNTHTRTN